MGKAVPRASNLIMRVDMLISHVLLFKEVQGQVYVTRIRKNFHKTLHDRGRTYLTMVFLEHITYTAVQAC